MVGRKMAESAAKRRKVDSELMDEERIAELQDENFRGESTLDVAHALHLMEKDVGITEYVGKHKGFFAILKRRYADFIVHEIDLEGEVVKLNDLSPPQDDLKEDVSAMGCDVLSAQDHKKMEELSQGSDRKECHVIEATENKEERTAVHEAIKKLYPRLTSSTSTTEDGKRVIKVMLSKFAGEKQNRKPKWPKGRGDYCKFVLYKENRDTMEAVSVIAKLLRIGVGSLHYSGTKDKRGITSQSVTVFRTKASRLAELNKTLKNMRIGNFSYVSEPLKLGDLGGNRFTVVLREIGAGEEEVNIAMCSLRDRGFINYFGMQRFGTSVIPTHEIGRSLLLCDWKNALELILKPRAGESDDVSAAREVWAETRDPQKALEVFPKRRNAERCALIGVRTHGPTNPLAAVLNIPRNTRLMYVHSYQSYVWNKIVSRRVAEHGMSLRVGDLVKKKSVEGMVKDTSEVDFVSDENSDSYTYHDLLLPLPGYDVLYPRNEVAEWYKSVMTEDGIDSHHLQCKVKDFALPGGYRPVFVKPANLSWTVTRYSDYTQPLVLSDLEEMEGVKLGEQCTGENDEHPHSAVIVRFTLPPSSYATIAIREIVKMDTSVGFQTSLNTHSNVVDEGHKSKQI